MTGPAPLSEWILDRIREDGPMPFERFMEAALYHPRFGYYCRPGATLGPEGDYRTSPEVHPAFGRLVARQVSDLASRGGAPEAPLQVIEVGPGRGRLAAALVAELVETEPALARRTTLTLVEISDSLKETQRAALLPVSGPLGGIEWTEWEELLKRPRRHEGPICVVANEFLDALPVRQVRRHEGRLLEVHVDAAGGSLSEVLREPSTSTLERHFSRLEREEGVRIEEGQRAEAGLRALDWVSSLGTLFGSDGTGGAILIDYGHSARALYAPARRDGTLMCYHRHRAGSGPYDRVGEQDMTAHVDFTSVAHRAREAGFDVAGPVSQMHFLVSLGIADLVARRAADVGPRAIGERLGLHALMAPGGMGEIFKVMTLTRGVRAASLRGMRDPFREFSAAEVSA